MISGPSWESIEAPMTVTFEGVDVFKTAKDDYTPKHGFMPVTRNSYFIIYASLHLAFASRPV